jgi:hypothetical protein
MGFSIDVTFYMAFMINLTIHAIVDDAKANKKLINLCVDQFIHFGQIFVTAVVLLLN